MQNPSCHRHPWTVLKITRMHSSRMRTAHSLTIFYSIPCILGESLPNPLDADPLPPGYRPPWMQTPSPGCRPSWMQTPLSNACWEANPPSQCMLGSQPHLPSACWETNSPTPCGQKEWHTPVKILPCPKLRLRVVKIFFGSLCYNR